MTKNKRFSFLLVLGVVASMLLAACGGEATPTTAPAAGATNTTAAAAPTDTTAAAAPTNTTAAAAPTDTTAAAAPTNTTAAAEATATTGGAAAATPTAVSMPAPPPVPNAADAKKYSGVTLTYYGGQVGPDHDVDVALATQFEKDTGIKINIVQRNADPAVDYSTYQRFFQAQSPDVDVMMMDVIWPGSFAPHLLDLTPKLGDAAKQHYPGIVANDTVDGKLIAMPWFSDFGILYYRTDLLQKYGYSAPPQTWQELTDMAKKIQDGEKASNPNFTGFVFQGSASEGLTCDVVEWLASSGGGQIVENGKVTFDNSNTVSMLKLAQSWVGTISPKGVTTYHEEDARNAFQGGNAAFERNWPYAYALGNDPAKSQVAGKFAVAPLPHGSGPNDKSVGTIGGWALGVSKYSKNPDAAVEWVRYVTSPEAQTWHAIAAGYVPTIQSVASDPKVQAVEPYLKTVADVQRVGRPSGTLGENYNEASTDIFQGVNQILNGSDVQSTVTDIAKKLQGLLP